MEKKPVTHIVVGLIISAVLIIFSLIINFTGQIGNQALGYVVYAVMMGLLVYFIIQYGKANDNNLSFGKLFTYGFKASAIIALITVAFNILLFMVFPDLKDKMMDISREQMAKRPGMTEEMVEQGMDMFKRNFTLFMIVGGIFMPVIFGAIASLIGAGVAKKNPPTPFQQQ
jgi:hypothetical protein